MASLGITGVCRWAVLVVLLCSAPASADPLKVTDDTGNNVLLSKPAQRIVSLAPHTTELLFAAGAGSRIVATVDYSDYPPAARVLPRVGGSSGLDVERIIALKPDLIVAWASGNPRRTIERLQQLGLQVYITEPRRLVDIARSLEHLGRLSGTEAIADKQAARFTARYRALAAQYANRQKLRVFYQILDPLLITVNGRHLISEVLDLCGGENIFAALPVLAPVVGEEAVLSVNPEVIVAGGMEDSWQSWQIHWRERTELAAVVRGNLYFIPSDLLHRHSPRLLDGAEKMCAVLDDARRKR